MKLKEIYTIEEGLSPVVYHFTRLHSMLEILKSNKINMSAQFTKPSEIEMGGTLYYLSTTRTRTGRYHMNNGSGVLIELDGRKLSQKYGASPVDYWGFDYRQINPETEQEDRIFSDEPEIRRASQYIRKIDLVYSTIGKADQRDIKRIKEIYLLSKRRNIEIRLFQSMRDLIAQQNPTSLSSLLNKEVGDAPNYVETHDDRKYKYMREKRGVHDRNTAWGLYYGLKFDTNDNVPSNIKEQIKRLVMIWWRQTDQATVSADIHNLSHDASEKGRRLLTDIGRLMRQNRLRDYKQAAEFVYTKWKEHV